LPLAACCQIPPRRSAIKIKKLLSIRLLTDPTFDPPGEYRLPHVILKKTSYPAIPAEEIGLVDAVLLSHDQHSANCAAPLTGCDLGAASLQQELDHL
jgi:hypothetical protein